MLMNFRSFVYRQDGFKLSYLVVAFIISYIFDIYKSLRAKAACYSNYHQCNIGKGGVSENTFPHRSTGYTVIGRGPRPAKVAL